ncbi:TetR/AcrR family transcriptional regulator [Actinoplanes sp. ATCC 53533]|uniref:TetR/AcrR family transcriptional regulator n=1 Tax=Actinoplanes sp. ATCC 53533 TaxID=1288362 RepID=UPI00131517CD|nr:TetR/AcrR family transcriptional regulator [Actinoplanes sp. ATCC 53533]
MAAREVVMARTVGSAAEETRRRILDVARQLFVERGYAGTSVQEIAEQVRMTKGSLYYHFSSKEELLHALMTPPLSEHEAFVADLDAAGTMTADLLARLVDIFDEHASLLRSLFGDPSVARELLRLRLPERMLTLQQAIGGGTDQAAVLRGRCVVGVIHAGVLTAGETATPPERRTGEPRGSFAQRRRLTADEKSFVVAAASAVLGVPASTAHATASGPGRLAR